MGRRGQVEMSNAQIPLRARHAYSQESFGKYSEPSFRSDFRNGSRCDDCMTRVPYATLIATIMCLIGVVVFCWTMYRGSTLTELMLMDVFRIRLHWLEAVQMTFVGLGAGMGSLGLMVLFVGFLTTGATRHKVYRAWSARVGGRISCAVFMGITYLLQIGWIVMFAVLVILTVFYSMFWALCSSDRVKKSGEGIKFEQFDFMFPEGTKKEDMTIDSPVKIKLFCKDYVEKAEVMFIMATFACMLVLLSLVHYLMCLSANYAHIRDHEKLQELQEMQSLNDLEGLTASKDRF